MVSWRHVMFIAYAALVDGLGQSSQSTLQDMREMAKVWSKTIQRKAQQQQQFASALDLSASSGLSSTQLQKLMKDVSSFAAATKERYRLEAQSGEQNTTRAYHHRQVLESIMKTDNLNNKLGTMSKRKKKSQFYVADSTSRLILLELVQVAATMKVWDLGADATVLHGLALAGMYFASSVLVFMDAGFGVEEAIHITWTIPTTNGWGDWSYDSYDIEDHKPMQLWMTLHVGLSAMVGCLGLQALADELFWDSRFDASIFPETANPDDHIPKWIALHASLWLGLILFGGWFYSTFEGCSCAYGYRTVPGCIESDCESTGGLRMDFIDAVYMTVLSLGSVGFGDFSPSTWLGKIVGFPFFLIGNTQRFHLSMQISEGIGYFFGRPRDGMHGRYD